MRIIHLLLALSAFLLPLTSFADVWQDPETKVNYTYSVGNSEASVTLGYLDYHDNSPLSTYVPGSPDVSGDIAILSSFTVDGNEYTVTSIGELAFYGCNGLTSVTVPNSVTSIGVGVFYNCSNLTSAMILGSVPRIEGGTFCGCSALASITIPNCVTYIGNAAFRHCGVLTSITIPDSLTAIGDWAFDGCSNLTSVHISDLEAWCNIRFYHFTSNPLNYAHHLFLNGEEVKELVIPNSVESIGDYAFESCSGLNSVTIPNSVTFIGEQAFRDCHSLTSLTLPDEIKWIRKGTFKNCSIKSIVIPAKVEIIFDEAFQCDGTEEVKVLAENPPFALDNAFRNYNVPLYVPTASINSYQSASPWNKFSSLNTLSSEGVFVRATPVLIQCRDGVLTIEGATEGTPISVYTPSGQLVASTIAATTGTTAVTTTVGGSVAIVKIGEKAVKVMILNFELFCNNYPNFLRYV